MKANLLTYPDYLIHKNKGIIRSFLLRVCKKVKRHCFKKRAHALIIQSMLGNRLKKRLKHLRKWARRAKVSCFRLYEKDIPEFPLILDWMDGYGVVWLYERKRDDTPEKAADFKALVLEEVGCGLELPKERIFVKERRRQRGLAQYDRLDKQGVIKVVQENQLSFELNLSDYLDVGLFLDHRNARKMVGELARDKAVLNLFAYTGSFSCYALQGGAKSTTTVDMSRTYCDWAKRNFRLNSFPINSVHKIINEDSLTFLIRTQKEKKKPYDLIVCDPPTFSNSKRMKHAFSVDRDYPDLIRRCADVLKPEGRILFSSNSRKIKVLKERLPKSLKVEEITEDSIPEDFRNKKIHQAWIMTKEG